MADQIHGADQIRVTVEHIVDGTIKDSSIIAEHTIKQVSSISELGFNHEHQINILKGCQDGLLKAQSASLKEDLSNCPKCGSKIKFAGSIASHFHSVFTDHKVQVKRQKCCNKECGYTSVPSISSLFETNLHPDLAQLQTEMACDHTFRESEKLMNMLSSSKRKINNHDRIHHVVETVGNYISEHQIEDIPDNVEPTEELICQVDGGHLKTIEPNKRSFEALTSVVYAEKNVIYSEKKLKPEGKDNLPRGQIISKHCAASALEDNLDTIKRQTLVATLKQGMTAETKIIALCDGAENCWNVIEHLEGECHSIVRILDWYHIAQKFQNISLPDNLSEKLKKIKWCIWHGQSTEGIKRFDALILETESETMKDRLTKLQNYLSNNKSYLIDYAARYEQKKVISSSLAESNVEHLINKRCKGKQHMKWSRKGVHPLLQVRASRASNDWKIFGKQYVLNALTQKAA